MRATTEFSFAGKGVGFVPITTHDSQRAYNLVLQRAGGMPRDRITRDVTVSGISRVTPRTRRQSRRRNSSSHRSHRRSSGRAWSEQRGRPHRRYSAVANSLHTLHRGLISLSR